MVIYISCLNHPYEEDCGDLKKCTGVAVNGKVKGRESLKNEPVSHAYSFICSPKKLEAKDPGNGIQLSEKVKHREKEKT